MRNSDDSYRAGYVPGTIEIWPRHHPASHAVGPDKTRRKSDDTLDKYRDTFIQILDILKERPISFVEWGMMMGFTHEQATRRTTPPKHLGIFEYWLAQERPGNVIYECSRQDAPKGVFECWKRHAPDADSNGVRRRFICLLGADYHD